MGYKYFCLKDLEHLVMPEMQRELYPNINIYNFCNFTTVYTHVMLGQESLVLRIILEWSLNDAKALYIENCI